MSGYVAPKSNVPRHDAVTECSAEHHQQRVFHSVSLLLSRDFIDSYELFETYTVFVRLLVQPLKLKTFASPDIRCSYRHLFRC